MPDSLGYTGILITFFVTAWVCRRWPMAAWPLFAGLLVRTLAVLAHHYVVPLPDSGADAITFERIAWEWAQEPLAWQFVNDHSYFISWLLSLLYRVTDRSSLMGQSLSLFFGVGAVFLGWYLARMLWGEKVASRAAWVMAFFPTLILYSALIMREAYIWFFAMLGLIGVVRWTQVRRWSRMLLALAGFAGASAFHGGMAVAALAFLGLVWVDAFRRVAIGLLRWRLTVISLSFAFLAALPIGLVLGGQVALPKLGEVTELSADVLMALGDYAARDGAAYPGFVMASAPLEFLWKAPLRVAYFMFAPFPWDVRSSHQLIGLLDGVLYIGLAWLAWRNRKALWADPSARWVLIIAFSLVLTFAFGVGNFGTALRHRGKVLIALIVLAAPMLRGFRLTGRAQG